MFYFPFGFDNNYQVWFGFSVFSNDFVNSISK